MTEGMTDLLLGILVMGIVVAVAFGFIIPLTNSDVMSYDTEYLDKSVTENNLVNSEKYLIDVQGEDSYRKKYDVDGFMYIKEKTDDIYYTLERAYTYEELMLLLAVQDDSMPTPNVISARNLMGMVKANGSTINLREQDYSLASIKAGKTSVDINSCLNVDSDTYKSAILTAIWYGADNGINSLQNGPIGASTDAEKGNKGFFRIEGSFNGAKVLKFDDGGRVDVGLFKGTKTSELSQDRKYIIKYEFQLSPESLGGLSDEQYKRCKYSEDIWAIEVVDDSINTCLLYDSMLKEIRSK